MAAEVKEIPLQPLFLFGLEADELHRRSHEIFLKDMDGKPVPPDYTHGPMTARLNKLRAKTREVELLAVKVFSNERDDIIIALNRLSSAFWWFICQRQNMS
jgi:ethanolamine utilization cobalamin adenosyltransferase